MKYIQISEFQKYVRYKKCIIYLFIKILGFKSLCDKKMGVTMSFFDFGMWVGLVSDTLFNILH